MSCQTSLTKTISMNPFYLQGHDPLNREAALSRMRSLPPDSDEYNQLQKAFIIKTSEIVEIILPHNSYRISTFSKNHSLLGGFGSAEHVAIGEKVILQGQGIHKNISLIDKGSIPIRFQEIIALAGDFYGVFGKPISLLGGTDEEKTERFRAFFRTLTGAESHQITRIVDAIKQEYLAVKHSSLPHHCYSNQLIEKSNEIKAVKKDIDDLLTDNSDHFSENAIDAYRIGHAEALRVAQEAGKNKNLEGLKNAYAIEAFACHFLTDLFAAGHIRNQRGALELYLMKEFKPLITTMYTLLEKDTVDTLIKSYAGLLTAAQHEKDGNKGLNVSNGLGEEWRSYGDGCFFTPKNHENEKKSIEAVQKSVDEVYQAFQNPSSQIDSQMEKLIPHPTLMNPPPLYVIEGDALFVYQDSDKIRIQDPQDYLMRATAQALRYLPETYVTGFLNKFIAEKTGLKVPQILEDAKKVVSQVMPYVEKVTGSVWHIVGIATYHQVKQQNQQLNEKIEEIGDMIAETNKNTVQILEEMKEVRAELREQAWQQTFREVNNAIIKIKDRAYEYALHQNSLSPEQLTTSIKKLWNAYLRLSRVFDRGTNGGHDLISLYKTTLLDQKLPEDEVKLKAVQWFRYMLDYQISAFSLYATLKVKRNKEESDHIKTQILEFEISIAKQIKANQSHIDKALACESLSYITLQLEKVKTRKQMLQWIK